MSGFFGGGGGGGTGDLVSTNNLSDVANAGTSRTNLGVGTGDSPQLAAINLNHASDTTITKSAAGKIAVEGKAVPLMNGSVDAVFAGPTAARTYTFPDADGTVVTLAATQTLTNKTLTSPTLTTPDIGTPSAGTLTSCTGLPVAGIAASTTQALGVGSLEVGHASDSTLARSAAGKLAVEGKAVPLMNGSVDAVFAGPSAARTYTFPDADGTVVTLAATQTLTSKTLTSPAITDATDVTMGTGTGTKFPAAANQKMALWGATPIVQPSVMALLGNGSPIFTGVDTIGKAAVESAVGAVNNKVDALIAWARDIGGQAAS